MEWLRSLRNQGFAGDVILITAFADIRTAIDALRAGASDFVLKPFRVDQIINSLRRCFERARLDRENFVLQQHGWPGLGGGWMLRPLRTARALCDLIRRVAAVHRADLGESGVGKKSLPGLHQMSPRAEPLG